MPVTDVPTQRAVLIIKLGKKLHLLRCSVQRVFCSVCSTVFVRSDVDW